MSTHGGWNKVEKPIYRWVPTIERILTAERLPPLTGPLINIFSDYSGEQAGALYQTTGILYADLYASRSWEIRRRQVRKRFLADGRRLSFKALGDRNRQAALIPFLQAADEIEGLCLVVAVRRSIRQLCLEPTVSMAIAEYVTNRRARKSRELERMARVTHLIALLIGGLAKVDQNVYWISDQDSLFANEMVTQDTRELLMRFSSHYVGDRKLGELALGTVAIDPGDRFEEDGAAIADLTAGALGEILTRVSSHAGGRFRPGVAIPFSGSFTPKSELLHSWFTHNQGRLRKVCIMFEDLGAGELAVFRLDM